jgi:hypothetical protein
VELIIIIIKPLHLHRLITIVITIVIIVHINYDKYQHQQHSAPFQQQQLSATIAVSAQMVKHQQQLEIIIAVDLVELETTTKITISPTSPPLWSFTRVDQNKMVLQSLIHLLIKQLAHQHHHTHLQQQ